MPGDPTPVTKDRDEQSRGVDDKTSNETVNVILLPPVLRSVLVTIYKNGTDIPFLMSSHV